MFRTLVELELDPMSMDLNNQNRKCSIMNLILNLMINFVNPNEKNSNCDNNLTSKNDLSSNECDHKINESQLMRIKVLKKNKNKLL